MSRANEAAATRRVVLRGAAFAISVALVGLWIRFLRATFDGSPGGVPAPGAFVVTLMFGGVALAGGVAAIRDVAMGVAISGLVSLVPVGLFLALFPPTRWITLLDLCLLAIGVALVRSDRSFSRPAPPESPGSDLPPSI